MLLLVKYVLRILVKIITKFERLTVKKYVVKLSKSRTKIMIIDRLNNNVLNVTVIMK